MAKHRVQKGDTLAAIAARYGGAPERWPELLACNPELGGSTTIHIGDELELPAAWSAPDVGELELERAGSSPNAHLRTSREGIAFIAKEEGWVDHVYLDQVGRRTIGYGHLVGEGENFPPRITQERGLELLEHDLREAEAPVRANVRVPLTQGMFDALVSLVFNLGKGNVMRESSSTLLRKLNEGDYLGAAAQFARWNKGVVNGQLVELPVLTKRRAREASLFLRSGMPGGSAGFIVVGALVFTAGVGLAIAAAMLSR